MGPTEGGRWSPALAAAASVVADEEGLRAALREAAQATRLAVDVEASGMFTYRARPCTVQLAWDAGLRVVVVDALAVPLAPLRELLGGAGGPVRILHDLAFDARLLAESKITLANVHDTAIAARMLGRSATGLAALLEADLGIVIGKEMQQHDWRLRPLDTASLAYLASDVAYLESLEQVLWRQVTERGIEQEVTEETRYRIEGAVASAAAPHDEPPYMRIRGVDRLAVRELAVLRVVAELREHEAEQRDVPPHKVAPNEALLAIARGRPTTAQDVARVRGISTATAAARAFAGELARAVASAGDALPDEERAWFERPRTPPAVVKSRRERETRLLAWRRAEATRRSVDEQVVLPGHCVKDAVDLEVSDHEALARVPGIGGFRVERDGAAIVQALQGPETPK
jgi:ribonuclease D